MASPSANTMILELAALYRLFRSTAYAMALQANTRVEWKTDRESTVLNIAYGLMPWKVAPGHVELVQNQQRIDSDTAERTRSLLATFLRKMSSEGPAAAMRYARDMERLRGSALADVQALMRDVQRQNAAISGEAAEAIRTLADIQFYSTLVLKGMACGLTLGGAAPTIAVGSTVVSLGYDIIGAVIKDGVSPASANTVAIEIEKTASQEIAEQKVFIDQKRLAAVQDEAGRTMDDARKQIAALNEDIGRKLSSRKIAKLERGVGNQVARKAGAEAAIEGATATAAASKAVSRVLPVIFLGHDIYGAWTDRQKAYQSAQ